MTSNSNPITGVSSDASCGGHYTNTKSASESEPKLIDSNTPNTESSEVKDTLNGLTDKLNKFGEEDTGGEPTSQTGVENDPAHIPGVAPSKDSVQDRCYCTEEEGLTSNYHSEDKTSKVEQNAENASVDFVQATAPPKPIQGGNFDSDNNEVNKEDNNLSKKLEVSQFSSSKKSSNSQLGDDGSKEAQNKSERLGESCNPEKVAGSNSGTASTEEEEFYYEEEEEFGESECVSTFAENSSSEYRSISEPIDHSEGIRGRTWYSPSGRVHASKTRHTYEHDSSMDKGFQQDGHSEGIGGKALCSPSNRRNASKTRHTYERENSVDEKSQQDDHSKGSGGKAWYSPSSRRKTSKIRRKHNHENGMDKGLQQDELSEGIKMNVKASSSDKMGSGEIVNAYDQEESMNVKFQQDGLSEGIRMKVKASPFNKMDSSKVMHAYMHENGMNERLQPELIPDGTVVDSETPVKLVEHNYDKNFLFASDSSDDESAKERRTKHRKRRSKFMCDTDSDDDKILYTNTHIKTKKKARRGGRLKKVDMFASDGEDDPHTVPDKAGKNKYLDNRRDDYLYGRLKSKKQKFLDKLHDDLRAAAKEREQKEKDQIENKSANVDGTLDPKRLSTSSEKKSDVEDLSYSTDISEYLDNHKLKGLDMLEEEEKKLKEKMIILTKEHDKRMEEKRRAKRKLALAKNCAKTGSDASKEFPVSHRGCDPIKPKSVFLQDSSDSDVTDSWYQNGIYVGPTAPVEPKSRFLRGDESDSISHDPLSGQEFPGHNVQRGVYYMDSSERTSDVNRIIEKHKRSKRRRRKNYISRRNPNRVKDDDMGEHASDEDESMENGGNGMKKRTNSDRSDEEPRLRVRNMAQTKFFDDDDSIGIVKMRRSRANYQPDPREAPIRKVFRKQGQLETDEYYYYEEEDVSYL